MQPAGWKLTQASRIALIILVIQLLGMRPVAPLTSGPGIKHDASVTDHGQTTPDPALSPVLLRSPAFRSRELGAADGPSPSRRPASVPIARWLPRVPPAS